MTIRYLNPTLINQIAAGEVIERPASAIKELVENAIDAGATKIEISLREGGRTFMSVSDNGKGMAKDDLLLSVERHATSKIPDENLFNIHTLGFRGEALPSIGAVSRLTLISRQQNQEMAWSLMVEGGVKSELSPLPGSVGTRVEIRDLFYATPARLKFLKTAKTELTYCCDIIQRLSLVHSHIHFNLKDNEKVIFNHDHSVNRLNAVLGKGFEENACLLNSKSDLFTLKGMVSIPTFNRSSSQDLYLFVNGRPVKDKLLITAIRIAYQDYLAPNRYPVGALFLTLEPEEVDINVHPAKAEVRFRDSVSVRNFIIGALKQTLAQAADRTSTTLAQGIMGRFSSSSVSPQGPQPSNYTGISVPSRGSSFSYKRLDPSHQLSFTSALKQKSDSKGALESRASFYHPSPLDKLPPYGTASDLIPPLPSSFQDDKSSQTDFSNNNDFPASFNKEKDTAFNSSPPLEELPQLGLAKAQIARTYIISETTDALIIVDQHAAHERLVYESLKNNAQTSTRQVLLIPEVITLSEKDSEALKPHHSELTQLGLIMDFFGTDQIIVREIPSLLGQESVKSLLQDLAHDCQEHGAHLCLRETLNEKLASHACHNSIRSGRILSLPEMNTLLRQMEETPYSGQCNHGRPTYIKLKKTDIDKLFGRC